MMKPLKVEVEEYEWQSRYSDFGRCWVSQEKRRHIYILYTRVAPQAAGLRYTSIIRVVFRISYTNPLFFSFLFFFFFGELRHSILFFWFETELRN